MPYLQLLTWYDQHIGSQRLHISSTLEIHIITDSQVVANWGTRAMSRDGNVPRKQGAYWAAMRHLRSLGYLCHFHWVRRDTTQLNWAADLIAGLARAAILSLPGEALSDNQTVAQKASHVISTLDVRATDGSPLDIYALD